MTLRLAVYMPDGSALLVQSVWIRDDHGRRGKIEVNPWTGLPSFDRVVGAQADDATADEDPVESEQEPKDPVDDFQPVPGPPRDDTPAKEGPENEP